MTDFVDIMNALEKSEFDVSSYRRKDKELGWVWEVSMSAERRDGRTILSVNGRGQTQEEAFGSLFNQLTTLVNVGYGIIPTYDDIPF